MKSPRVCHIATMTQWGGVERILIDFLSQVDQTPVTHSLLTTSSASAVISPLRRIGIPTFEPTRRIHYDPTAVLQMAHWLRAQRIGIVHAYNAVGNAWGYLAAALAQTPIYISGEHGSVWRIRSWMYWLNRLAYQKANMIIVNSEASKTLVCHRYKVDHRKVRIIYNIVSSSPLVDREQVRAQLGLGSEVVIGSVGRLSSEKGYRVFVDAAREVLQHYSNVKFLLIGGGEQQAVLTQHVHNLGISDRFILTGWREDARILLQAFDIFVSTSIHESFGNVFLEAAMAGIPVIAPNVDGIPEAVEEGVTGRLIRPVKPISNKGHLPPHVVVDGNLTRPLMLDPVELANTIIEFVENRDMRDAYGKAGRQRARTMFTTEKYMADIQSIYSGFLQG